MRGVTLMSLACLLCGASAVRGQTLTPSDAAEGARFAAAVRAAVQGGYAHAVVVGHGEGAMDSLFALTAERGGSGVLIVLAESGTRRTRAAELERARTPADLGLRGIRLEPFLGSSDLVDVVVRHEPFQLETSRSFTTHHLVRRGAAGLEAACEFAGEASSSSSKGIGSVTSTRSVTVEPAAGGPGRRFAVRIVDETTERSRQAPPVVTAHADSTIRFELPAAGSCRPF